MKYIKGLDTLRAFAVIFVIIWHWSPHYPIHTKHGLIQQFIPTGGFGVTLFFVLSGYLITSILLKAKEANTNRFHVIKNFIIRRSLRLFPVYYLLIIVLILIHYSFVKGGLPYYLTYTSNFLSIKDGWSNFSHTWSLSVEEQFYLIWPWLILFIPNKYLKYLFPSCILIAIISVLVCETFFPGLAYYIFTTCCFDAFGIGGLYAYMQLNPQNSIKIKRYIRIVLPFAFLLYFSWIILPLINRTSQCDFLGRTVNSIISIWLIDITVHNKSEWFKNYFFENRVLNYIGKISYGLYLYHFPILFCYFDLVPKLAVKFPSLKPLFDNVFFNYFVMGLPLFIIASFSFEFFEKKITGFKKKFSYAGT